MPTKRHDADDSCVRSALEDLGDDRTRPYKKKKRKKKKRRCYGGAIKEHIVNQKLKSHRTVRQARHASKAAVVTSEQFSLLRPHVAKRDRHAYFSAPALR